MHLLRIKILDSCPNSDYVREYYQEKVNDTSYSGDSGVDLIFPETNILYCNQVNKCGLGVACEFIRNGETESSAFDLVGRSSISKTPLMLANAVGIFDAGYRGEVIAALRCFPDNSHQSTIDNGNYQVEKGTRLVQIVSPDRRPIRIEVVDELSTTERGENNFGSTGV